MKKLFCSLALLVSTQLLAGAPKIGVVNFSHCLKDSKLGKQEQSSFEAIREQLTTLIEDTEKQLKEISDKLEDPDYIDGISPDVEEQQKSKCAGLREELGRQHQQYYQFLQQGQYKTMQAVASGIHAASERIASAKGFDLIFNKDACFHAREAFDLTPDTIKEMDKIFENENKKEVSAGG